MKKRQAKKIENRELREAVKALKRGGFLLKWIDSWVVGEVFNIDIVHSSNPYYSPEVEITIHTDMKRIRSLKR